jgi:putative peptidoglycan lipid II flippase
MSQMLKSSGATAAATMLSRVLGLVREMAYSHLMGTSLVAGAFVLAFQIPNLFRRLLGEGALTAAFIPIFKQKEKTEGEAEMWHAANAVISGLIVAATAIVGLGIVIVSILLGVVDSKDLDTLLMLRLLRIMFPYLILVCFAAVCMGMLNARGHFFVPALGAAMLNVAMIASVAVCLVAPGLAGNPQKQVFGLAIGVLVAGAAQAAFQMPLLLRDGFRLKWVTPWKDPTVRQVVQRMLPATIGVAAFQLNVMLANGFTFFAVDPQIVAAFSYAVRLMELPQGVFGISLALYLLPTLSGLAAEKKYPEFRTTLRDGIGYLLFINLLATILLLTLATPMIRLLFEHGEFDAAATHRTSIALMTLAPGLIAFSCVNILARAFYALHDTKTPMKISVACLIANALLTLPLVWVMREAGLGLANTVTGFANAGLLAFALRKKIARLEWAALRTHVVALIPCAIAAIGLAWSIRAFWESRLGHATFILKLGEVFVPMTIATLAYFIVAIAFRIPFAHDFLALIRKRLRI